MGERFQPAAIDQALRDKFANEGADATARAVYYLLERTSYRFIRSALTGKGLTSDECADLLHEVTEMVLVQLRHGETSSLSLAVLRRIIRFTWVGHLRRHYGRKRVLTWVADEDLPEQSDPATTPEETAMWREHLSELNSYMGKLPTCEREAFQTFASGMPAKDAAQQLGITLNTYQVRISRARRKLQSCLTPMLPSKETTNEPK